MQSPDESGKALETPDPRARRLSGPTRPAGEFMTEAPKEGTPAPTTPDVQKIIDELKAANVALVEKITALEAKSKSYDEKITALSGAAAQKQAADQKAKEDAKSEIDAAYERAMQKLGFRKEE